MDSHGLHPVVCVFDGPAHHSKRADSVVRDVSDLCNPVTRRGRSVERQKKSATRPRVIHRVAGRISGSVGLYQSGNPSGGTAPVEPSGWRLESACHIWAIPPAATDSNRSRRADQESRSVILTFFPNTPGATRTRGVIVPVKPLYFPQIVKNPPLSLSTFPARPTKFLPGGHTVPVRGIHFPRVSPGPPLPTSLHPPTLSAAW